MIIASIDIGSNTVILLIAKFDKSKMFLTPLANYYRIPRISENIGKFGIITKKSLERLISVFDEYQSIINEYSVDKIILSATNAFRIARNSEEIIKILYESYNWEVNVISGEKEAELTFLGSLYPEYLKEEVTVIDIGGGSTEIIYGNYENISIRKSYQVGIVTLFENFVKTEIPAAKDLSLIRVEIQKSFAELPKYIPSNSKSIAVAGTPTTLSAILNGVTTYSEDLMDNTLLRLNDTSNFISELGIMTPGKIKAKYGNLVEGREDLILVGSIILEEFMKIINIQDIIVSTKGLRYGAVLEYLNEQGYYL